MIWLHCGNASEQAVTCSLALRLAEHRDASDIVITTLPDGEAPFDTAPNGVDLRLLPADNPAKVRMFLDGWKPQSLIWIGGALRPVLLRAVERAKIPATLINATNDGLVAGGSRWLPGAARAAVAPFQRILTMNGATATRLVRGGVPRDRVQATGPILEEPLPLPHDQYELAVMAEALETRPVWFAADVVAEEVPQMAAAHLAASRKNHRLLMLMTPRDIDSGPQAAQLLRKAGFKVGLRSDGDDPDPEQQVYVADLADEMGLWFRLCPLTFMGGTLSGGVAAASPFEPTLLGSAVIHGPHKSPHEVRFARLAQAEACREIRSASELGVAVGALISPEQTARIALAGWEEISRNAATINGLVNAALASQAVP